MLWSFVILQTTSLTESLATSLLRTFIWSLLVDRDFYSSSWTYNQWRTLTSSLWILKCLRRSFSPSEKNWFRYQREIRWNHFSITFKDFQANCTLVNLLLLKLLARNQRLRFLRFLVCVRFRFFDLSDNIFLFRRRFWNKFCIFKLFHFTTRFGSSRRIISSYLHRSTPSLRSHSLQRTLLCVSPLRPIPYFSIYFLSFLHFALSTSFSSWYYSRVESSFIWSND